MDFRNLITALDNINTPILSEALTMSAVIAATSGYEQDDKVRLPLLAKLARDNQLEGLVDPVTGNFVDLEGEEDDEVPFEIAEKLSAAGLLPTNAKLPQAGWFDNNRVYDAANSNLKQQSSGIASKHDYLAEKMYQLKEILKKLTALRDAHATSKMQSTIGEKPILPSNAPSAVASKMTPAFSSQTLAGLRESAGLADCLVESFKTDFGDTMRGAYDGATLGLGADINAGLKSYFKDTKFKDELNKELAANAVSAQRSPRLYNGAAIAGSMALPGGIMGKGLGVAGKAALGLGAGEIGGYATDRAHEIMSDRPINWDGEYTDYTEKPHTKPVAAPKPEVKQDQVAAPKPEVKLPSSSTNRPIAKAIDAKEFQAYLKSIGATVATGSKAATDQAIDQYILGRYK